MNSYRPVSDATLAGGSIAYQLTLIVTDAPDSLPQLDNPVPYNAVSGGRTDTPYIYGLTRHTAARPSHTALKDYSFKKPSYSFQQAAQADGTRKTHEHPRHERLPSTVARYSWSIAHIIRLR
ncbi:contractile injection system protein, VgrG/Pvc8 family [Salinivibrio sp. IB872]|uniref:contractile injection system protein, VgrG/Pvc8 family n=1 Tax=Salinivibrio sp. IB872 TaxID=1766123 RepID=UPI00098465D0|nr:contractile injection system protein, VgrG/Pvc8 family [Salinivibrio sp. IB872]OOF21267.1 hypothetical protein BZJ18_16235 [Salinivibrio sp. IB872]